MDESSHSEAHLTSAAAFVEGGIQEACDDSCSICLESFSETEPSTVFYNSVLMMCSFDLLFLHDFESVGFLYAGD